MAAANRTPVRPRRNRAEAPRRPHTRAAAPSRVQRALTAAEPLLEREVAGLPLRVPGVALLTAAAMLPVGLFLTGLGVLVLQASGGAAQDTSLVVMVAAFCVTDFWGGSVVHAVTKRSPREVMFSWVAVRAVMLLVVVLLTSGMWAIAPIQLALAAPAAWLGVRVGQKQAALRGSAPAARRRPGPLGA